MAPLTLPRVCHMGLRGPDVLAYSSRYKRAGLRSRPRTRHFGAHMHDETVAYQKQHGIKPDGVIGPKTFNAMRAGFSSYERWLLAKAETRYQPSPRELIVGAALAAYRLRPFTYIQTRPYPSTLSALDAHGSDCSGCCELFYLIAHKADSSVPDPSHLGFSGYGFTGTMVANGRRVSTPQKGDLVFYYPDHGHVGLYLGSGRVFSHGKPGDPQIISPSLATMFRSYL